MPADSATIRQIVQRGLFDRLPATFSSYTFDRIRDWSMLFPPEQSYFERLLGMLDRSEPALVDQLFAPLAEVERKMGIDRKKWTTGGFNLGHVDFLQRSPYYAEWRGVISGIFGKIDPLLDEEIARNARRPRLVVVVSPSELPSSPDRMWKRIDKHGRRVSLKVPDSLDAADYLPLVLTGAPRAAGGASLLSMDFGSPYSKWIVEAANTLAPYAKDAIALSYGALEGYRNDLMKAVREMLEAKQLRGPQQLGTELKKLKTPPPPGRLGADPLLADFVRSVMLAGNGTLLINNTFTEWATVQAVRRARPLATVIRFGVRNKVKPFSSLLIYQDQDAATPIPSQMDSLGSLVDLEIFYQYVWQEFEKYPEYRGNTAYLFLGEGLDEMLVIAPPRFAGLGPAQPALADVHRQAKAWLESPPGVP